MKVREIDIKELREQSNRLKAFGARQWAQDGHRNPKQEFIRVLICSVLIATGLLIGLVYCYTKIYPQ